jgi:adenylate cyclase
LAKSIDTERRLVAIFAADVEGYSRLMGANEVETFEALTQRRTILDGLISAHRGRIANTAGDSVLAEFVSAVDAVRCAVEAQAVLAEANANLSPDRHINFRIGVHVGDVMVKGGDLFGDGVNIAARLQGLASAGGTCISSAAHDQVRKMLPFAFVDLGAQQVKNIEEPVRAFAVSAKGASTERTSGFPALADNSKPLPLPDKPSIAVLPFQNMSGDPEQDYFADGISEDIITALSKWRWFFVIARNSSFSYRGRHVDLKQVSRELGVRYVLEGSVRKADNRVRVTAQLIDTNTLAHMWAERYDRDLTDVFAIQDEVTQQVAAAIEPALSMSEIEQAQRKTPEQMVARDYYFRGMWHFHKLTEEESQKAIACFHRALELDNTLADAYVGIARTVFSTGVYRFRSGRNTNSEQVSAAARSALALDPGSASACYILALDLAHNGDCDAGVDFARRAIELNDNFALGYFALAVASTFAGLAEEALAAIDRALRLSPNDPQVFAWRAQRASALYLLKRYAEAVETARQSLSRRWFHTACRVLAASYAQLGAIEPAGAAMRELLASDHSEKTIADVIRPFKRSADRDNYSDGLRKAGMPEQ